MSFEIKPSSFRVFDPLPLLLSVLMEVPGLRSSSGTLYSILVELYSNALEHGVLGLDSSLKTTAEGFNQYYALRAERLESATSGFIRIHLDHSTTDEGGTLRVRIVDSGKGFDRRQSDANLANGAYSGRGLALLEKICNSVRYLGPGNEVEVEFCWANDA